VSIGLLKLLECPALEGSPELGALLRAAPKYGVHMELKAPVATPLKQEARGFLTKGTAYPRGRLTGRLSANVMTESLTLACCSYFLKLASVQPNQQSEKTYAQGTLFLIEVPAWSALAISLL